MGRLHPLARRLAVFAGAALLLTGQSGSALGRGSPPPDPGAGIEPLLAALWHDLGPPVRTLAAGRTPARLVVGLASTRDAARLRRVAGVHVFRLDRVLRFAVAAASPSALRTLARLSWVRYVEAPHRLRPLAIPNDPFVSSTDPVTGLPYAWQFTAGHVDRALDLAPGNPDFLIGIVDSGADVNHPDLASKIAGTNGDVTDTVGHGTFVAAMAAGTVGDGVGIAGFGGASHLFIVRDELFTDDSLASSIRVAADEGVRVINMSWGGPTESKPIADAVAYAAGKGVLLVAAAGNEFTNSPAYPAVYLQPPSSNGARSLGLAVGASDPNGNRAFFSNFGDWVSLLGPGAWTSDVCPELGVFSAIPANPTLFYDDQPCLNVFSAGGARWVYSQGTSFGSPAVAGAAALAWSVNPSLKNFEVGDIIKQSAARPAGTSWSGDKGWGLLDVAAAVELAGRYDSVAPKPVLVLPPHAWADTTIPVSWSATDAGFAGKPSSGIDSYEVRYRVEGGQAKLWQSSGSKGSAQFLGRLGSGYTFFLRVTDKAGNVSDTRGFKISVQPSKTRVLLDARSIATHAGGRFLLRGKVFALTPGGSSAFGAGPRVNVLVGGAGRSPKRLTSGSVDARGNFSLSVPAPPRGSYDLVVEFAGSKRLESSYSAEVRLVSL